MTPERWQRVEELYHAAHARPAAERAAFLAEACHGDERLRREVESLLSESSQDGFLAAPSPETASALIPDVPQDMTGHSIGAYHLDALLGAGGMGEVYRSRDARLGRDVAIKILPRAFTSHPDRLARLEREARMLAALNHPNICAIYGFEQADGIRFLVLELVEGATLAHTLAHVTNLHQKDGGLPLGQVLGVAQQIAEALEVAHEKGIIHRDLKPANIKITPDGAVKILDFGLAKIVGGDGPSSDLSSAPTEDGVRREGPIIGTAAYMSPEQARGLTVDKRTDIWAFGCVLYEMLTGRVAFSGDTISDSIAKILEREPDWSALPAATPAPIRRLLLRCLTKDPKQRLRDIGDVRIEIDAIDEVLPGTSDRVGEPPAPARTVARWLPWVALVALAVGVGAREVTRPRTTENPLANARFTSLTNWEGTELLAEISPDGRFVIFFADKDGELDLWWTQVGSGQLKNLTQDMPPLNVIGAGMLRASGFSGNGAEVWLGEAGKPNILMPQTGGTPRPFLGLDARTPAWSADGRLVFDRSTADGDSLLVGDSTGADARQIEIKTSDVMPSSGIADPVHSHNPVWSPDNQSIYFVHGFVREWNQKDEMDIWRVAPSGGTAERLTHLNTAVTFLAPLDARRLLYIAREENGDGPWLWALDVPSKTTQRATLGLEHYTSVSASRDGRRVVAVRANPSAGLWTVPILDRPAEDSAAQPYSVMTAPAVAPRFGGTSLFYLSARGTDDGLWGFKEGKSFEVLKGADGPLFEPPAPSPDGRHVAVVRKREGKHRLTIMSSNGAESRSLAPSIDIYGTADWSPDSAWVVTGGKDAAGLAGLFMIPVDGQHAGEPVRLTEGAALNPVWSPDGSLIVYSGPFAAGQVSLLAVRPDRTVVELPPSRVSPGAYRFLHNGSGLVYLPGAESLDFWLLDLVKKEHRQLTRLTNKGRIRGFDITPDGKHIVFDRVRQNSDIVLIDLPQQ